MALVIWARFFKLEWCRNHPQIWSADDFWTFWDAIICAETFVACKSRFFYKSKVVTGHHREWWTLRSLVFYCHDTLKASIQSELQSHWLGRLDYFVNWRLKEWRCILRSELRTQRFASVYYFQNWKLLDWEVYTILGTEKLKALEVYTIFGTENWAP